MSFINCINNRNKSAERAGWMLTGWLIAKGYEKNGKKWKRGALIISFDVKSDSIHIVTSISDIAEDGRLSDLGIKNCWLELNNKHFYTK